MQTPPIHDYLSQHDIDAWLVYDFRSSNPIFSQLLDRQFWTTRRAMLIVPQVGEPVILAHAIDAPLLKPCGLELLVYRSWMDWERELRARLHQMNRVAMEYVAGGALPAVSCVDAGTIEFVRACGCEVVSSRDLIQISVARWSDEALRAHRRASELTAAIKDEAFSLIGKSITSNQRITEYDVQQFILKRFAEHKLDPDHPPIVAINEHSGDPHFDVAHDGSAEMERGDWILIDLWSRQFGVQHIFSDITWVGYVGTDIPEKFQKTFDLVARARDAAFARVKSAWTLRQPIRGCDLDAEARSVFEVAGELGAVRHRTGHSLSPGPKIHGLGANLDDYETRDTRLILPETGFTIEPALYYEEFGCRSEINAYVDPRQGPILTSPIQHEIIRIG